MPVELRFADEEPIRTFIASVASAAGFFAGVDVDELPEAARRGVTELRAACEAVAASVPSREVPDAGYRGAIVIEWPKAAPHGVGAIIGRMVSVYDAFTGGETGPKPITTVSEISLRVSMDEIVTADLTMFADEAGDPILDGQPVLDGDEIRIGVFPFLVAEMRVRDR